MIRNLTYTEFIGFFKTAVQFYPVTEEQCQRPNTFAMIDTVADMSSSNLRKSICDKGKNYFFSREWANNKYNPSKLTWTFPIVMLQENNLSGADIFRKNQKWAYTFQLIVLDQYDESSREKRMCDGCKGRLIAEIFLDTEAILRNILRYITTMKYGHRTGETPADAKWYPYNLTLADFVEDTATVANYQRMLKNLNASVSAQRYQSISINNAYGTSVTVNVNFDYCNLLEWDVEQSSYITTYDEGCC